MNKDNVITTLFILIKLPTFIVAIYSIVIFFN